MKSNKLDPVTDESTTFTRLSTFLATFVIPLFKKPLGKRPVLYGSGFFVGKGSDIFLISAAHVLDEITDLHFYIEPGITRKLSGRLLKTKPPTTGNRTSDRIDVAVLKLEGSGLPPYPKVNKQICSFDSLRPKALPRAGKSKQYIFVGFPSSKSNANPSIKQLTSEAISFRNISAPANKYDELNVSPEYHIVLPLDIQRTVHPSGEVRSFPKPSGLSGSPMWLLDSNGDAKASPHFPLVGIVTEHHKKSKVLVATDIAIAIEMIESVRS